MKVAEQTRVEHADGVLRIEVTSKNQFLGPSGSIEVTVQLPAGSTVEAKAPGAELRAVGRLGDVAFEGAHGSIKIDEAASARLATAVTRRFGRPPQRSRRDQHGQGRHQHRRGRARHGRAAHAGKRDHGRCRGRGVGLLDAGTTHGRIHNALKNDGAAQLDVHATTAHGDIVARSL